MPENGFAILFRRLREFMLLLGFSSIAAGVFPSASWGLVEPLPDWMQRIRIGGSGAVRYMDGEARSHLETKGGFMVYQVGITVDADINDNLSFWYDTGVLREGRTAAFNEQIYGRYDRILGSDMLNVKVGRTFMPFGEEYLRWNNIDNPLNSYTVSFPWAVDEGMLLFGDFLSDSKLSYAAAVQNGNAGQNFDDNSKKTVSFKLSSTPTPWLYVSASYLNLGKQGDQVTRSTGTAEFWLSGFHIAPLGATSAASGPSPSAVVNGQAGEGNVKLTFDSARIWLNYGYMFVNDGGGDRFDRIIRYYTGEVLGYIPKTEQKGYLVGRYSAIGTFNPDLGYRFAGTEFAVPAFRTSPYSGFNNDQRDLYRYSLGAGWRLDKNAVLKLEHSWEGTHLIERAKTATNLNLLDKRNFFIAELALRF
jgi:hypothetical protein